MNFVGIDLHKKTISICVVTQEREILDRKRFYCSEPERIVAFFESNQAVSRSGGGNSQLRMAVGFAATAGRAGGAGPSQEDAGHCREHP